ncbi:hypothetical protein EAF04_002451 [Stromatinia cepivora]|nr:hypothetical protein EAF04_002451 [Stromatinia cepivora]
MHYLVRSKIRVTRFFHHFLKYRFSTGNTSSSICMRPEKDTLMLESSPLISLYRYGGYITMNSMTRLALTEIDPGSWSRSIGVRFIGESKVASIQVHLFQLIRTLCPTLEKIHIIIAESRNWMGLYDVEIELRIIDLDSEFPYQDFTLRDPLRYNDRVRNHTENTISFIYRSDTKRMLRDWKRYINGEVDEDALEFLKTRTSIPGLLCCFEPDLSNEPGRISMPKLHITDIDAWLPAHADGTMVDKYKGLAQIFDGVPWSYTGKDDI